jgi:phage terminase small subunit
MNRDREGLSLHYWLFAEAYLECFDAEKAAIAAGADQWYEGSKIAAWGRHALRQPKVAAYIDKRVGPYMRARGIERGRILEEMRRVALFDFRKLYRPDGTLKEPQELDDDTAAAILFLEIEEEYSGRGDERENIGRIRKYKAINKEKILALLAEHLGIKGGMSSSEEDRLDEVVDAIRNSPAGNAARAPRNSPAAKSPKKK